MRIGLVGEAPSDTKAIEILLKKRYTNASFETLIKDIRGSELDNPKTVNLLRASYNTTKPDFVVFIRDLDALENDRAKKLERLLYFRKGKKNVNHKASFLLHIFEIEALVLTDIDTFNKMYSCTIEQYEDVMLINDPKKILKDNSKYSEGDTPDIFSKINFEKTLTCRYFKEFITELDKHLN